MYLQFTGLHTGTGVDKVIARIDSVEFTRAGQAYALGRYPVHWHLAGLTVAFVDFVMLFSDDVAYRVAGAVPSSYVRNCAMHHTYQRAVTTHGCHYARVHNNVAYSCV